MNSMRHDIGHALDRLRPEAIWASAAVPEKPHLCPRVIEVRLLELYILSRPREYATILWVP